MMLTTEEQLLIDQIKERIKNPKRATLMADRYDYGAKPFPPATLEQVEVTEAQIGFRLPELIRAIYIHVGNGGFGIGGVEGGQEIYDNSLSVNVMICRDGEDFIADLYEEDEEKPNWHWGNRYIMYCYWGCNVTTLVDCGDPSLPVYSLDSDDMSPHSSKMLHQWWRDWLDGTIQQY